MDSVPNEWVPIEDLETRRQLWHCVWDWIICECERLAADAESEATPPEDQA